VCFPYFDSNQLIFNDLLAGFCSLVDCCVDWKTSPFNHEINLIWGVPSGVRLLLAFIVSLNKNDSRQERAWFCFPCLLASAQMHILQNGSSSRRWYLDISLGPRLGQADPQRSRQHPVATIKVSGKWPPDAAWSYWGKYEFIFPVKMKIAQKRV
jgi:hypothetical protein